jgi:hypothetical protein
MFAPLPDARVLQRIHVQGTNREMGMGIVESSMLTIVSFTQAPGSAVNRTAIPPVADGTGR